MAKTCGDCIGDRFAGRRWHGALQRHIKTASSSGLEDEPVCGCFLEHKQQPWVRPESARKHAAAAREICGTASTASLLLVRGRACEKHCSDKEDCNVRYFSVAVCDARLGLNNAPHVHRPGGVARARRTKNEGDYNSRFVSSTFRSGRAYTSPASNCSGPVLLIGPAASSSSSFTIIADVRSFGDFLELKERRRSLFTVWSPPVVCGIPVTVPHEAGSIPAC